MQLTFTKGHGTENDFVLVRDLDATVDLTAEQVRRITDRHAGLGADGVIRVVRARDVPEVADQAESAEWFMDYRNADGVAAEMCGNGVRVFVSYLLREGLVDGLSWDGGELAVATRAGTKRVRVDGDELAVDLGPWRVVGGEQALDDGGDARVAVHGLDGSVAGLSLDLGNPHTVVMLPNETDLAALDLTDAPHVTPEPPNGTNVEFVVMLGAGHVRMRVHERGVGETRSCGTGAAAAALAARAWTNVAGGGEPDAWRVDVPGGTLRVLLRPGGTVELAGPAELVADGTLTL
ncbi:diaminopimelate epimerase [Angustibacter sp. McL0619]|uniref:diaminopimelate epimerase n=1 Tax=Angustibacter sp. McL0619 TaxID=3415676 RepID=UPI003CE707CC